MADETPTTPADPAPVPPPPPAAKKSPDGLAVAIRSPFEDDPEHVVQSFVYVNSRGMSGYKTAEQVADWTDV